MRRYDIVSALILLVIVGITTLAILGVVLAGRHSTTKCPPGWKPNTGYLQQAGSCIRQ